MSRYHPTTLEELEAQDPERRTWDITTDSAIRLDKYLANRIGGMSRAQIQKLIALGGVTIHGRDDAPVKTVKPSYKLQQGDRVDVVVPPKPAIDLSPEPIPLDVLFEDDDFIVINKQANLIVHPARSRLNGTMVNALAWHLKFGQDLDPTLLDNHDADDADPPTKRQRKNQKHQTLSGVGATDARPGVVHRLDMHTTGCIVFAKQDATHWLLAKQFEHRTNLKCYLALVHGCPDGVNVPLSGAIDEPLGKHPTIREGQAVRRDAHGKEALTLYRVRRRYDGYSLVELELKSGRTHQIRVHLSYLGFPIVGDLLYGGVPVGPPELEIPPDNLPGSRPNLTFAMPKEEGKKNEAAAEQREQEGESPFIRHPALHAGLLQLEHPVTHERMTFTAPLHEPMRSIISYLEKHANPKPGITDGTHIDLAQALGALKA
ncbi:MAG: RluA family pseudouridine synthase [Planctomycetota bacterium]